MPKVRLSSGTIGTTCLPMLLSLSIVLRMRTKAIVVEISRPSVPLSCDSKAASCGTSSAFDLRRRAGRWPPSSSRRFLRYLASGLSGSKRRNSIFSICSSVSGSSKRVRKSCRWDCPIFFC